MSDIALRVHSLSKLYHIGARIDPHATLRDSISDFGLRMADLVKRNPQSEVRNSPTPFGP